MEHRIQTYLAALQCLTVLAGSLLLSATLGLFEEILVSAAGRNSSLALARLLAGHGLWLLALPAFWVAATLRGQRLNRPWANRRTILITGTLLLAFLTGLYFLAALLATNPLRVPLSPIS
jgi:hypothetical protein